MDTILDFEEKGRTVAGFLRLWENEGSCKCDWGRGPQLIFIAMEARGRYLGVCESDPN
jgi:hypothetical protein